MKLPCSSRSATKHRRPANDCADIDPPMMMPAIGTRAAPSQGTAPERKITARTGTTPQPIATATHGQARGASIRREDVKTATPNMKAAKTKDQASWLSTAVITNATAASCTMARTAALAMERSTFSRPTHDAAIANRTKTTRAITSGNPG
jgi:hypothetical protein